MKRVVFPALDILAGLPSVVYGVWGILVVVPWISDRLAPHFVEYSTGYSTLAAGIVLGIIEIFSRSYISTQLSDIIVFAVLIIVLLVKPTGLLGKKIVEKV